MGACGGSDDGGRELFDEFCPNRRRSSAISANIAATCPRNDAFSALNPSSSSRRATLHNFAPYPPTPCDPLNAYVRFGGYDYIEVDDLGKLEPQTVTVEAWVRRDRNDGQRPNINSHIVAKGAAGIHASSYALYTGISNGLDFYVALVGGEYFAVSLPPTASGADAEARVWDGAWHHAAGTFAPGLLKLYLDGEQVATSPGPDRIGYPQPTDNRLYIGMYDPDHNIGVGFTGDIDEVTVWNRVLTDAEIASHAADKV